MYTQVSPAEMQIPAHWNLQHDHPAVSIITQQYSAATFVSLKFHSYMERFGILAYFLTYGTVYIELCQELYVYHE